MIVKKLTKKNTRGLLSTISLSTLLLSTSIAFSQKTEYPLTIQNCGNTLTFTKAPERTASIGQGSTEILYLLGLADKVVGTSLWFGPILKGYEEANKNVEVIAQNIPSFEGIVGKNPDLVTSQFEWQVGSVGVVATYEQFNELSIPVYTSPSDCVGKDSSQGGDGTRSVPFTMNTVYQEIEELSKIFDVQTRGSEVIKQLKEREIAAKNKVKDLKNEVSAVFWFSSAAIDIDPYVAGMYGPSNYIMNTLGIKNIIESPDEWPTVGWETIAKANPTILVLGEMERRRFPADDIAVKKEFLKKDPVTSLIPAVKENRLIPINVQAMNATIRTIEGIEEVANAIEAFGLNK